MWSILVTVMCSRSCISFAHAQDVAPTRPLTTSELRQIKVTGPLGTELGQCMTLKIRVTTEQAKGNFPHVVSVLAIDGKELKEAIIISAMVREYSNIHSLPVGQIMEVRGYQTASWLGDPKQFTQEREGPPPPTTRFGLNVWLIIYKTTK